MDRIPNQYIFDYKYKIQLFEDPNEGQKIPERFAASLTGPRQSQELSISNFQYHLKTIIRYSMLNV